MLVASERKERVGSQESGDLGGKFGVFYFSLGRAGDGAHLENRGRVGTCLSCSTDKEPWFSGELRCGDVGGEALVPLGVPWSSLGHAGEYGRSVRVGVRSGS